MVEPQERNCHGSWVTREQPPAGAFYSPPMKQPVSEQGIIEGLETVAAAFPWESVEIWIRREPNGDCSFVVYLNGNKEIGLDATSFSRRTVAEAVEEALRDKDKRDPEIARLQKIRALKEQAQRLESVVLGLPPYRPGCWLTEGTVQDAPPIEVATVKTDEVPF